MSFGEHATSEASMIAIRRSATSLHDLTGKLSSKLVEGQARDVQSLRGGTASEALQGTERDQSALNRRADDVRVIQTLPSDGSLHDNFMELSVVTESGRQRTY
jgi:hypothetical protein